MNKLFLCFIVGLLIAPLGCSPSTAVRAGQDTGASGPGSPLARVEASPTARGETETKGDPSQSPQPSAPAPTPIPPSNKVDLSPSVLTSPLDEVVRGAISRSQVAVTFDAGSVVGPGAKILDTMRQRGLKVTFFITGEFADKYPEVTRQIAADGHELANHTYSHPDLATLSDSQVIYELERADASIKRVTGQSSKPFMRPPFGSRDQRVLRVVKEAGYRSIYWTLDSGDWRPELTAPDVQKRVLDNVGNGYIVVFHLASPSTAEALPAIIQRLGERGLSIVKLSQLLNEPPSSPQPEAKPGYSYDLLIRVDKEHPLPSDYKPPDLADLSGVPASRNGLLIRKVAMPFLTKMFKDAEKEGLALGVVSAYRSYVQQQEVYQEEVARVGQAQADRYVARPGYSEHQLGTAVDISSPKAGYGLEQSFGETAEGKWLRDNSYRYGFIMSYPQGKEKETGYAYEPWHFRYVGVDSTAASGKALPPVKAP